MPLENTTSGYKIPYWWQNELSSGVSNRRAAQIVDNQLLGLSTVLGPDGIISEGTYQTNFATGASQVKLVESSGTALEAMISGKYVYQAITLTWSDLPDSSVIYLYASTEEANLFESTEISTLAAKRCVTLWNTSGITPSESILIGIATTTGSTITLDTASTIADSTKYASGRPLIRKLQATADEAASLATVQASLVSQVSGLGTIIYGLGGLEAVISSVASLTATQTSLVSQVSGLNALTSSIPALISQVSGLNAMANHPTMIYLPNITTLSGNTVDDFHVLPTSTLSVGTAVQFYDQTSGVDAVGFRSYRLFSGLQSESLPFVVLPNDRGPSNARFWKLG